MLNAFFSKMKLVLKDPTIRRRIVFTLIALVLFRALAAIPIPGIDSLALQRLLSGSGDLLGFFDVFSGGGLSSLSIVMLGVGPYITASIIIQVMSMVFPKIKNLLHEEGEAGRVKLSQYSRLMSVLLAVLQALGFVFFLKTQGIVDNLSTFALITNVIIISAGSVLLMWLGELVSEFGIGNGVSLIIFAGIVATIPRHITRISSMLVDNPGDVPMYLLFAVIAVIVIGVVVAVTEAERPIPVHYAKQIRGSKVYGGTTTYLPLRLNMAGVIPIIFALSILILPRMAAGIMAKASNATVVAIGNFVTDIIANQWLYGILYFIFVCLFTYFYTAVTFDPYRISENLQHSGAFIPGVRPGEATSSFLAKIVTRITLVGAIFLAIVAILPLILQGVTGNAEFAIGGTALLIAVSVVLDLVKKIDAQASMREY